MTCSFPLRRLRKAALAGFTLIEMMVVVAIMMILLAMAVPTLTRSILRSKESVLRNNLSSMRRVLDDYCYDKGKCPQSLQDLVTEGYLRSVPTDPMNNNSTDWRTVLEDPATSVNEQEPGIWDVHSLSDKSSSEGTPYADW